MGVSVGLSVGEGVTLGCSVAVGTVGVGLGDVGVGVGAGVLVGIGVLVGVGAVNNTAPVLWIDVNDPSIAHQLYCTVRVLVPVYLALAAKRLVPDPLRVISSLPKL